MSEVSFNSVDFDEFDGYRGSSFSETPSSTANFYEKIFAQNEGLVFTKIVHLQAIRLEVEKKTQSIAQNHKVEISPMGIGGSAETRVEVSWGGKNGTEVTVGVSGEIHDDKGNYARGDARRDSDGRGNVSVSGGHRDDGQRND